MCHVGAQKSHGTRIEIIFHTYYYMLYIIIYLYHLPVAFGPLLIITLDVAHCFPLIEEMRHREVKKLKSLLSFKLGIQFSMFEAKALSYHLENNEKLLHKLLHI